jgi:preprotein translocase subunit SecD
MFAARLRGAACASLVALGLTFFSFGAAAEPLRLFFASVSEGRDAYSGKPALTVRLTEQSRQQFALFTQANLGQKIDIRVDGKSMLSPVVREPITGGILTISVSEPVEAHGVAERLSHPSTILEVDAIPD